MSEPITFNLFFSIPQIDSAFMRNPAGGGRLKLDIDQATVSQVNAMLDMAVARAGTTFAAVVVVVEQPEAIREVQLGWKAGKPRKNLKS